MYNCFIKIVLILVPTFLLSCSCFIYPEFKVKNYYYNENFIRIEFNTTPDLQRLQQAFNFLEDEYKQTGYFKQTGKLIDFFPLNGINKNHNYKIIITTDAENSEGISLANTYTESFSTKDTNMPLQILSVTQIKSGIQIDLSSSVDPNLFIKSFNIAPSLNTLFEWNETTDSFKIKFTSLLDDKTHYFVTLSKDLYDKNNNHLQKEFNYTFFNENFLNETFNLGYLEQNKNIYLSDQSPNTNLSYKNKLLFSFNNNSDEEEFPATISIFPKIDYTIKQSADDLKKYFLTFLSKPDFNSTYTISVDYNPNHKHKHFTTDFIITFNALSDYPPEFCGGAFNITNSIYSFTNQYKTLSFPVDLFPTISSFHSEDIKIYFIFSSKNKNFQLSKDSLINYLTISSTNNCIDIKPYDINFINDEALKLNIFKALEIIPDINSEYSIIEYCCHIQNKENKGMIKISLGNEICDSNSNTLGHNLTYIFNKQ